MLKYFLGFAIIVTFAFTGFVVYLKMEPPPQSLVVPPTGVLVEPNSEAAIASSLLSQINQKLSTVKSAACEDVRIKLWEKGFRFHLTGKLYMEKPKRFRFLIYSTIAQELDLGANDEIFWFWSRKNKTPGLYYATHANYYQTRLKTPFNPTWIRDSLGFSEIPAVKIAKQTDTDYLFVNPCASTSGTQLLQTTFIDRTTTSPRAIVVTDSNGKVLASAEIQEKKNGLPYRILYTWLEEGDRFMQIELNGLVINPSIDTRAWNTPSYQPVIDMAAQ